MNIKLEKAFVEFMAACDEALDSEDKTQWFNDAERKQVEELAESAWDHYCGYRDNFPTEK